MSSLPLPIRLAAGLAAITLERARKLPQDVTEWPMTAVSRALQISMRVQQRITELAIKGDEALAGLREPQEDPPWAVFDEDLPRPSYLRPETVTGTASGTASDALADTEGDAAPDTVLDVGLDTALGADLDADLDTGLDTGLGTERPAAGTAFHDELDGYDLGDQDATAEERSWFEAIDEAYVQDPGQPNGVAAEPATGAAATPGAGGAAGQGTGGEAAGGYAEPGGDIEADATDLGRPAGPNGGPSALPAYPGLSLASLRGRLRVLSVADLEELLVYERDHQDRPEFVRMLTNRIATVRRT